MKKTRRSTSLKALEKAAAKHVEDPFELKLFITGSTSRSLEAVARIKELCETNLKGRYTLEVIDVHQQPQLAEDEQIVALPTLLKTLPPPMRKVLGTFNEKERLLAVLGLTPTKKHP